MDFAYLMYSGLYLIPWLILYLIRKDLRKQMIWASMITAIGGLFCERYWYTQDWVTPLTITKTLVGVEDLVLGWGAGGIGAVLYKEIFRKDDYKYIKYHHRQFLILPIIIGFILADMLFRHFGYFSFYANLLGFGLIVAVIFSIRRDLIREAIGGGFLLVVVSLPIYWLTFHFFPGWRESYWNMTNISKLYFLKIPYEDIVWWFLVGMILSIVYDYTHGMKVRKEARR